MADRIISGVRDICESLSQIASADTLNAVLLSPQKSQFCLHEPRSDNALGVTFDILPDINSLYQPGTKTYDVCILCCHNEGEEAILFKLRKSGIARLYFVWLWDNHHHHIINLRTSNLADVVFVSHYHEKDYLNQFGVLAGAHIPACSRQWSPDAISQPGSEYMNITRKDALFGGFGNYSFTPERTAFIKKCQTQIPGNAISLVDVDTYFRTPPALRLRSWLEHKVHLLVPVNADLSTRLFEALMTGQIPLIPDNVTDLNRVIPPELQAALPVLRYQPYSIRSVHDTWREALARFSAEGMDGIQRRHVYARDYHSLTSRLSAFAHFIRHHKQFDIKTEGERLIMWSHWA